MVSGVQPVLPFLLHTQSREGGPPGDCQTFEENWIGPKLELGLVYLLSLRSLKGQLWPLLGLFLVVARKAVSSLTSNFRGQCGQRAQ